MKMKKKFRVVKIIDDKSLIINGGVFDGVNEGDIVTIIGKSEPVVDPETRDVLGKINVIKAKLNVCDIYEKMSVCEAQYVSDLAASIIKSNPLFATKQKALNVDPFDISGSGDKMIRIGDEALVESNSAEKEEKNKTID